MNRPRVEKKRKAFTNSFSLSVSVRPFLQSWSVSVSPLSVCLSFLERGNERIVIWTSREQLLVTMATLIRSSSATISTIYTHFIIFVVVAVFNFTVLGNELPVRLGYGVCLILLALVSLLLNLTSQNPNEGLLRSLLMTLSALWASVGTYHVVASFVDNQVLQSEALFSGYLAFLIIFLFFIGGGLHHNDKASATLALGMFLSCIFEIAALWTPVRRSAGAYYLLLAALTLYLVVSKLFTRFRGKKTEESRPDVREESSQSKDYIPAAHAMNCVASAAFACQATGIYDAVFKAFSWVLVAGVFQLVFGVVAVRRSHNYNSMYFFFHGLFWLTNGFNLCVVFVSNQTVPYLTAATIVHFIIFATIAAVSLTREMFQVLQNVVLCILCVAILVDVQSLAFVSVMGWILFILTLYTLAAHVSRVQNSGRKLPLGARLLSVQQLSNAVIHSCNFLERRANKSSNTSGSSNNSSSIRKKGRALFSIDFTLGYSRYATFDLAGFAISAVAAVALIWTPQGVWILPWAVAFGGLSSMVIGSVCFARGLSFESCAFFTFGALWAIWGPFRGLGALELDNSAAVIPGCVGFLAVGLLLLGLSTTVNKAWSAVLFFFSLMVVGILLNAVDANGSSVYEIVITVLFVIACLYCFVAFALKSVWGREVLPLGRPFLQVSYLHSQGERAFWADGRTASGVRAIADIMNAGGICGIPTDVVYVLVAALKFPAAIERAYNTKKLAEDRPMSMWISKVEQIEEGRALFGEMVWGLMNEIWPSTVSLVVPKGDWYDNLGVGESGKYIGRPDSIAVRMPDNTVTSHLIDQTGPVATTSANPTGEADTTHHLQVLAKLGLDNVDGILCSGPSPENMASTVVDCRNLNEGRIGFFRIGVVPRSHVEAVVAKVKAYHDGSILPSISRSTSVHGGGPQINEAFEIDENEGPGTSGENILYNSSNNNTNRNSHNNNNSHTNSHNNSHNNSNNNNNSHTNSHNNSNNNNTGGGDNNNDNILPKTNASHSPRSSTDMSSTDSTTEDNATLIHVLQAAGSGSKKGTHSHHNSQNPAEIGSRISGHSNKAYETLVQPEGSENPEPEVVNSPADELQEQEDSDSTNPYEPMQFKTSGSAINDLVSAKNVIGGFNDERQPEFKINPIFRQPSLTTQN